MPSIFIVNMSSAAAGSIAHLPTHDVAETLGQGDASRFFLSLGETVERVAGPAAAEEAMYALATVMALADTAAENAHAHTSSGMTLDQRADLAAFVAERVRHNVGRLFPTPEAPDGE